MRGRFIVIDGIDGCGKTTQIEHLSQWLPSSGLLNPGVSVICTREPGGTALGQSIRQLLLHSSDATAPAPTAELLLYAADRAQHVDTVIQPALERGDWVLSVRFSGSTLAYQGYGRGLDRSLIERLESIATRGLQPDLTVWLTVSLQESMRRRLGEQADRIEAEGQEFLQRVVDGFGQLAETRLWCPLNGNRPAVEVTRELKTLLRERLG